MSEMNRRKFIKAASAAGAFTIVPRYVLGGAGNTPPSEKLNIAGIGIGGMGASNLQNLKGENIVALCDVDYDYAGKTFDEFPKAERYRDYRAMLDKQKDMNDCRLLNANQFGHDNNAIVKFLSSDPLLPL